MQQALHARVDVDAAAGIADADQVRMAVPDLARIEALPGGADQLVPGEARRQPGEARIPEALLGPGAARRRAAERGEA
jgi:hypothetical protein